MSEEEFKEEIRELARLIMGEDGVVYKRPEELDQILEDFKLAQERAVVLVTTLDAQLADAVRVRKEHKKGKHSRDLHRDEVYVGLLKDEERISMQLHATKELMNVIAWFVLGNERAYIRQSQRGGASDGFIADRNLESELEIAKYINSEKGQFALVADLTSCILTGDLLVWSPRGVFFVEVKDGNAAEALVKATDPEHSEDDIVREISELKEDASISHAEKQVKRFRGQWKRLSRWSEFTRTDEVRDEDAKQALLAVETETPFTYVRGELESVVESVLSTEEEGARGVQIIDADCFVVGVLAQSGDPLEARRLFAHHSIYHHLTSPWEACEFEKEGFDIEQVLREHMGEEPWSFLELEIFNLIESLWVPNQDPLPMVVGSDVFQKLISEELTIFTYFRPELFEGVCRSVGLDTDWLDEGDVAKMGYFSKAGVREQLVDFGGKYLGLSLGDANHVMSMPNLWAMVFDLQTGESVAGQLRDSLEHMNTLHDAAHREG